MGSKAIQTRGCQGPTCQPRSTGGVGCVLIPYSQSVLVVLSPPGLCIVSFFTTEEEGGRISRLDRFLIRQLKSPNVGVLGHSFGT